MDGFTEYLNQIGRVPLLTPVEEITLGNIVRRWLDHPQPAPPRIARAGRRAHERITQANLRLSVRFAARFKHLRNVEFEDLVQAGNLGLIRAAEKFDPALGYRFSTYAYWWIWKAVTRYIERQGVAVSMPGTDAERLARLAPVRAKLRAGLGREPTLAEVGEVLGISADRVRTLAVCNSRCLSLDAPPPGCDATCGDLGDLLVSPPQEHLGPPPEVLEALGDLPPLHRRLMAAAVGAGGPPMAAAAIAKGEGMTTAQVRRLLLLGAEIIGRQLQPAALSAGPAADGREPERPPGAKALAHAE